MERKVEREKLLPAFSISVAELEVLWIQLQKLFDEGENKKYGSITITLPSEKLVFDTIEELKQYKHLKGKVSNFSLMLSEYSSQRHITISSGYTLNPQALLRAAGDNEAWCAGVIEVVMSFLQNHKAWYSWFVTAPLGWCLVLLINVPTIHSLFLTKEEKIDKFFLAAWIAITITIAIIYIGRTKLLPSSIIRLSNEESFIKKYGIELSLIIAIVSAILTIIGWFVSTK